MAERRVVITGLGMLSPVGNNVIDSWDNILKGKSGAKPLDKFDVTDFDTKFAATVDLNIEDYLDKKEIRRTDPFIQYGLIASQECVDDSQIKLDQTDLTKFGVSIGSGIGGLGTIEENKIKLFETGPKKISPFFVPGAISNMVSGYASLKFGLKGPNISIASACSSASHSIGYSFRSIAHGDADLMLTGGAEMATTPLGLAGFNAAKALSTRNDNPQAASRPWDKDRDGFVLGEGAGCLLLEEYEHALSRGAKIYAEIIGFGMSADAHHITSPPEGGAGAALSMNNAIKDANINVSEINYVNAHGTSTPAGDIAETDAVKSVFQDSAKDLIVSSTKSMTGHLLGAAGAVEAIFSILSIRDNVCPPTINLDNPDDGCDLNYSPNKPTEKVINNSLSNSFGFGGTNASLIFKDIN
ncbi:beta-ketoacyl-ACP synthase II [Gammaproteobacteria bacterium]|nr:beta-ketoacyl-ACP synthase II [Gammaproteobacteria bacterium]MDC3323546.1 beta-ketoacyl-ACP synthase II [Gammaproteobacteria bacterium]|tara:strand:+ start:688 stop:1926 length:1239 start_codon:yes stop_codon:yes gene_type:complete